MNRFLLVARDGEVMMKAIRGVHEGPPVRKGVG